jgi:tetratricopeptide (TPR) repeat protein
MEVRVKPVALCTWIAILLLLLVAVPANGVGQQTSIDEQRQTAIALEQQGRNAEAENAWRAVMQAQPSSAEAYAHLGFLEARQERYRQAIPLYRKALAVDPRMPGLEMNLGLALFKAGDLKAAVTIFNKLLKAEAPSRAESRRLKTLIGMAEYGLQDYSAAIPYLKEATTEDPQNLPFRLVLAHSCFAAKQYQCVLDVYREILNLNAESAEADMLAGEALDEMQDHAGAIQQFRAAVKANPKEPNVHFGLGYLLWTQGQYAEAADQFQAELTNVPDHAQALVYLADSNIKLRHINEAQRLLQKAVRIKPDLEMAHLDLGVVYADSGRQAEALRELKFAAKMNPEDVAVHWRLAQLYRSMGRRREAEAEFEKTKTLSKAADESVSSKLNSAHSQTEGAATGVPAAN